MNASDRVVVKPGEAMEKSENKGGRVMNASVKVMNSYDYCHFEVTLSSDDVTLTDVDNLRKEAQRLVDKAIKQYKISKKPLLKDSISFGEIKRKAEIIKQNYPKDEWSPEQKAIIKAYEDLSFKASLVYDYQDDWVEDEDK